MSDLTPPAAPMPDDEGPLEERVPGAADEVVTFDAGRAVAFEVDEELVANIEVLIEGGQRGMVLNLVADLHPADLAELMSHLPVELGQDLLHWLPTEDAANVLPELESAYRADLLDELPEERLAELIDEISTDDAADVLGDLPDDVAERVLPQLEDRDEVETLLGFEEDSAGGLMETDYVAVPETATVAEATEEVRRCAEDVDPIYVVYVTDARERLVGVVPLTRLLLARADTPVRDILETDLVVVEPDEDQEAVARLMERYDLTVLPVVTAGGRLLGRITIDDIVDVIREEAEEDFQRASGIAGSEELSSSVLAISRGRLPWLVTGLAGSFLSGLVIKTFEVELAQAVVLATFIPIVTAMGGNAAIQSAAITVQGLSSGDLWVGQAVERLTKELAVAFLNGLALALLICGVVLALGLGDSVRLALTVGLTLLTVVVLATTNGTLFPLLLHRMGIDPASAMGPFVTTLNDILGLTVYFIIAMLIYL